MLPLPFLLPPKEFNNNKFLEMLPRFFALSARLPSELVAGVWGSTVAHATVAALLLRSFSAAPIPGYPPLATGVRRPGMAIRRLSIVSVLR